MNESVLRPLAEAMFEAAAGVLGSLANRDTAAGTIDVSDESASIRTDGGDVATITRIPGASLAFVARYDESEIDHVVALMLGTEPSGGEPDAMHRSIIAETVSQISAAMGEALATRLGASSLDIAAEVPPDAGAFPPPPFAAAATAFTLGDLSVRVALAFDGVAQAKLAPAGAAPSAGGAGAAAGPTGMPSFPVPPPPPARPPASQPQPVQFANVVATPIKPAPPGHANLELVHDVPLEISAVLGQTELSLREVVAMVPGSVFELDKLSSDPVDLYVNDILIARGEVVVVDDKFAVKISELNPVVDRV